MVKATLYLWAKSNLQVKHCGSISAQCYCFSWQVPVSSFTHQSHPEYLGEGVRRAAGGGETEGGARRLEPGSLAGPHNVTQRQDGRPQAQGRTIDGHHNRLFKMDECLHEVPEERNIKGKQYCTP